MDYMFYLRCGDPYSWTWIQVNVASILYIFTIRDHNCYLQPLFVLFCLCDLWSMNYLSLRSSQRFIAEFAWFIPRLFVQCFVSSLFVFFLLIIILSVVASCTASNYSIGILFQNCSCSLSINIPYSSYILGDIVSLIGAALPWSFVSCIYVGKCIYY